MAVVTGCGSSSRVVTRVAPRPDGSLAVQTCELALDVFVVDLGDVHPVHCRTEVVPIEGAEGQETTR